MCKAAQLFQDQLTSNRPAIHTSAFAMISRELRAQGKEIARAFGNF